MPVLLDAIVTGHCRPRTGARRSQRLRPIMRFWIMRTSCAVMSPSARSKSQRSTGCSERGGPTRERAQGIVAELLVDDSTVRAVEVGTWRDALPVTSRWDEDRSRLRCSRPTRYLKRSPAARISRRPPGSTALRRARGPTSCVWTRDTAPASRPARSRRRRRVVQRARCRKASGLGKLRP